MKCTEKTIKYKRNVEIQSSLSSHTDSTGFMLIVWYMLSDLRYRFANHKLNKILLLTMLIVLLKCD